MDTLQDIKTKTDEEILAEIKTLNVEISRRRQIETKKKKQPTEEPVKRGRPKKTDQTQSEQTQSEQPTEEVKRYRAEWRHKLYENICNVCLVSQLFYSLFYYHKIYKDIQYH